MKLSQETIDALNVPLTDIELRQIMRAVSDLELRAIYDAPRINVRSRAAALEELDTRKRRRRVRAELRRRAPHGA